MSHTTGLSTFFANDATVKALDDLARADRITFFVGAGVSMEAGLPSWPELIDRLLRHAAHASGPFRERRRDLQREDVDPPLIGVDLQREAGNYARWMIATHGLLGAAAVVKAWLPQAEYHRVVEACLYEPVTQSRLPLQPGPTALQLASLWIACGPSRLTVLTTNYDLLIERALVGMGVKPDDVITLTEPQNAPAENTFNVLHLHGVVREPPTLPALRAPEGALVLAEDEYFTALDDSRARLRRQHCEALLDQGSCMFMGTGLTDPNLLTYLYSSASARQAGSPRHYALIVKQADQPPQLEASATVLATGREAAATRLRRMRVEALQADFFSQCGQFLAELRMRRDGSPGASFLGRLDQWRRDAAGAGLLPDHLPSFAQQQQKLQRALDAAVRAVAALLDSEPSLRCPHEHLALHLWVHDPTDGSLVFVARSDQRFLNAATLERQPIEMPIGRLVIEAVCSGAVLEASGDDLRSSRWRSMIVVPTVLDDSQRLADGSIAGSIPVGALVLASSEDGPTGLSRLRDLPTEREGLIATLAIVGSILLNPNAQEAA